MSALCVNCRRISPQALIDQRPVVLPSGIELTESGLQHVSDYTELAVSAKTCAMCTMLYQQLKGERLKQGRRHSIILTADKYSFDLDEPYQVAGMDALVEHSDIRASFHVFADPVDDASLSGDIAGRPIPLDPRSKQSFANIRSWLGNCSKNHTDCQPTPELFTSQKNGVAKSMFPTRLLYLGDLKSNRDICRLVDRSQVTGDYVALSYCWGMNQQLRTLSTNIASHLEQIKLADMPLTLREAVAATREIGISYLWIDALCIIQDDSSDWEREAPQMGEIYRNAYCTIAAAGSDSSAGGLFHSRQQPEGVVTIEYQPKPGRDPVLSGGSRTLHLYPIASNFVTEVEQSIWNTRGWILQERNLSRRLIIFGKGQTFFECQQSSIGEDGRDVTHYQNKRLGGGSIPQGSDWEWCLLVEDFTSRRLTYIQDRLFAIDGLARSFAAMRGAMYCAGLWVDHSPLHLLWYLKDDPSAETGTLSEDKSSKRAPSWSWGSVNGPVMWEPAILEARTECKLSLPADVADRHPGDIKVREARLSYQGNLISVDRHTHRISDDNGPTNLEGRLLYLIDIQTHPRCYALIGSSGERLGWAAFDDGDQVPGPFVAAFISRNHAEDETKTSINVLILKEVAGMTDEYVRVGVGELTKLKVSQTAEFKHKSICIR
ncbi:hypothetical protein PT974_02124 [Cladobotryum mycophilum]|uniref:Heterokaryon incompatibility domain-containing protein n=1 Tax=Cladobotryum mycophilum TaxID=491253 RepID=A0ABR0SY31_9HYPO